MKDTSSTHSIIPAQPGYKALMLVDDGKGYPEEWFPVPIIAWAVHVKLENNRHECIVDPICDADDQVAEVFQRPDGTVVIPHMMECADADEALEEMRKDYARTQQLKQMSKERRESSE